MKTILVVGGTSFAFSSFVMKGNRPETLTDEASPEGLIRRTRRSRGPL
jgi:hypothetical protein